MKFKLKKAKAKAWAALKGVTVEPVMLFFALGLGFVQVTNSLFYFDKVCRAGTTMFGDGVSYDEETCDELDSGRYPEEQQHVQEQLFRLTSVNVLLQAVPTMFFVLFVGPWSDHFGRRALIVMPLFGYILMCGVFILNASYMEELSANFILLEVLQDLTGGMPCLFLGLNSYISDVSSPAERTTRLAALEFFWWSGRAATTKLSSVVFINRGYVAVYATAAGFLTAALLYALFAVRESKEIRPSPTESDSKDLKKSSKWKKFSMIFSTRHLRESFGELFSPRPHSLRPILLLTVAISGVAFTTQWVEQSVFVGYIRQRFEWEDTDELSSWVSTQRTVAELYSVFGLGVATPVMSRYLNVHDNTIMLLGLLGFVVEFTLVLTATDKWFLYVGLFLNVFAFSVQVGCRAVASKIVHPDRLGRIFACISFVQALTNITVPLANWIYSETQEWHPGLVYCLLCTVLLWAAAAAAWIHARQRKLVQIAHTDPVLTKLLLRQKGTPKQTRDSDTKEETSSEDENRVL